MNIARFIAARTAFSNNASFSRLIVRIAIVAIALSMAVMIIANALVTGFKTTISEKIFGFWGHVHITHLNTYEAYEVTPISIEQDFYPSLGDLQQIDYEKKRSFLGLINWTSTARTNGGIRHIQPFVNKEGVIKTKTQIEGIVLRGVDKNFDWQFLHRFIVRGDTLPLSPDHVSDAVMISEVTAKRLEIDTADSFVVYFVQDGEQRTRKFKVCGIYKTGLEEYDQRYALADMRQMQQLNNYRPYKRYENIEIAYDSFGIAANNAPNNDPNFVGPPNSDLPLVMTALYPDDSLEIFNGRITSGRLVNPELNEGGIVISEWIAMRKNLKVGDNIKLSIPDGDALLRTSIDVVGIHNLSRPRECFVAAPTLTALDSILPPEVGGFEVFMDDIQDLDAFSDYIYYNSIGPDQNAQSIRQVFPSIFDWLELQNINEVIILTLMILISIINMITALLILILDRTNMIGILKSQGMSNWSIRQIFLYHAAYITGAGMLLGNALGLFICFLQYYFGIIRLPEDLYYVSVAPVVVNWGALLWLNLSTMLITILALIVPSWLVTRISPVKAIRFK